LAACLLGQAYGLSVGNFVNQMKVRTVDHWLAEVLTSFSVAEFFNGHNTDKAHPFIEDCISKQQPLVKVTVYGVACVAYLLDSVII